MSLGETLNVAARLQTAAEPGTVVASETTIALVEGRFDVTTLGPLRLGASPSRSSAIGSWAGPARARASRCPQTDGALSCGREVELTTLGRLWAQAKAGQGAAVLVTGDPGVGKSRLALQLRDLSRDGAQRWMETMSAPYTRMSVLRPVVDLIEDALSLRSISDAESHVFANSRQPRSGFSRIPPRNRSDRRASRHAQRDSDDTEQ